MQDNPQPPFQLKLNLKLKRPPETKVNMQYNPHKPPFQLKLKLKRPPETDEESAKRAKLESKKELEENSATTDLSIQCINLLNMNIRIEKRSDLETMFNTLTTKVETLGENNTLKQQYECLIWIISSPLACHQLIDAFMIHCRKERRLEGDKEVFCRNAGHSSTFTAEFIFKVLTLFTKELHLWLTRLSQKQVFFPEFVFPDNTRTPKEKEWLLKREISKRVSHTDFSFVTEMIIKQPALEYLKQTLNITEDECDENGKQSFSRYLYHILQPDSKIFSNVPPTQQLLKVLMEKLLTIPETTERTWNNLLEIACNPLLTQGRIQAHDLKITNLVIALLKYQDEHRVSIDEKNRNLLVQVVEANVYNAQWKLTQPIVRAYPEPIIKYCEDNQYYDLLIQIMRMLDNNPQSIFLGIMKRQNYLFLRDGSLLQNACVALINQEIPELSIENIAMRRDEVDEVQKIVYLVQALLPTVESISKEQKNLLLQVLHQLSSITKVMQAWEEKLTRAKRPVPTKYTFLQKFSGAVNATLQRVPEAKPGF